MSRLQLTDTTTDIIVKMSEGNPGALNVMVTLLRTEEATDPDSALAPLGTILALDEAGVYGSSIWRVYKEICLLNITYMIGLFRAIQLGVYTERQLQSVLADTQNRGTLNPPLRVLLVEVKKQLPNINFVPPIEE